MSKDVVLDELSDCADAKTTVSRGHSIYLDSLHENEDCVVQDRSNETKADSAAAAKEMGKTRVHSLSHLGNLLQSTVT